MCGFRDGSPGGRCRLQSIGESRSLLPSVRPAGRCGRFRFCDRDAVHGGAESFDGVHFFDGGLDQAAFDSLRRDQIDGVGQGVQAGHGGAGRDDTYESCPGQSRVPCHSNAQREEACACAFRQKNVDLGEAVDVRAVRCNRLAPRRRRQRRRESSDRSLPADFRRNRGACHASGGRHRLLARERRSRHGADAAGGVASARWSTYIAYRCRSATGAGCRVRA